MAEKTDAQRRAQKTYMSKFCEVKVRMTHEQRDALQEFAKKNGVSVTSFINGLISREVPDFDK